MSIVGPGSYNPDYSVVMKGSQKLKMVKDKKVPKKNYLKEYIDTQHDKQIAQAIGNEITKDDKKQWAIFISKIPQQMRVSKEKMLMPGPGQYDEFVPK